MTTMTVVVMVSVMVAVTVSVTRESEKRRGQARGEEVCEHRELSSREGGDTHKGPE